MSPDQAHRVGELAGRSGLEDVVDVTVVEGALRRGDDVVVTSNESHIRQVVDATGKRLRFETF
jgi:translation initiation factor IF-2